jgi:hypothetical protein
MRANIMFFAYSLKGVRRRARAKVREIDEERAREREKKRRREKEREREICGWRLKGTFYSKKNGFLPTGT